MSKERLLVVIDRDIPYIEGVLEPWVDTLYMKGAEIRERVLDSSVSPDALIIRTRTRCDAEMLSASKIKFIASATIGNDHVDLDYCSSHGIEFVNAPGSNSGAVMQYVFTALYYLGRMKNLKLEGKKLGVIGVGSVGSRVVRLGKYLGFDLLKNDPPRALKEGDDGFVSLDELLRESDIVTIHIPLSADNYHFANSDFFSRMKDGAIFINTSRGEVVDEKALLSHAERLGGIILDVWENEPDINRDLLEIADIATPHIAGYSLQGKINSTTAVVKAFAHHFNIPELMEFDLYKGIEGSMPIERLYLAKLMFEDEICDELTTLYPIYEDDEKLREHPEKFEELRSSYKYRKEFYFHPDSGNETGI